MKIATLSILLWVIMMTNANAATTLVDRLLADYAAIESVSCEVRKDSQSPAGSMRRLSRVYFQKPDHLHVDTATPIKRRIVANGTHLYSYIAGDPKGFARPIDELGADWQISLRNIPGSAMEHLLNLKGVAESELPGTEEFPVRMAYQTERLFVVLAIDTSNRLARIDFYTSSGMEQKNAQYVYQSFQEVTPGAWLSLLHEATLWMGGIEVKETTRISNLAVNQAIAPSLFVPANFFKGVEFVAHMEEIYPK